MCWLASARFVKTRDRTREMASPRDENNQNGAENGVIFQRNFCSKKILYLYSYFTLNST